MADKDQYEFPESEDTSGMSQEEVDPSTKTENVQSILKNKRILTSLGIVAGVFILSHVMNGSKDDSQTVMKPDAGTQKIAPIADTSTETPAQTIDPSVVAATSSRSSVNNGEIQTMLDKQERLIKQSINEIKHRQDGTYQSVQTMYTKLDDINKRIDTISQRQIQLAQITDKLVTMKAAADKAKKPAKPVVYSLKAAVEGRAWVEDGDHQTVTVSVGDALKNYGKVTAIDPVRGMISTSSGKVIAYAANDR